MQYAAAVATDPSCQTIMTALLFVVNRPYLVGIVPVRDEGREKETERKTRMALDFKFL